MISYHSVNQITKSTVVHYNHCNNNNTGLILFYLFLYCSLTITHLSRPLITMHQSGFLVTTTLCLFPAGLSSPTINSTTTTINYLQHRQPLIYSIQPPPKPIALVPVFNQYSSNPQSLTLTLTLNLTLTNSITIIRDHSQLFNFHLLIVPIADFNGSEFFEPPGLSTWKFGWKISKYTFYQLVRPLLPQTWVRIPPASPIINYQLQLTKYI
jgi:hypothetical protein